MKRKMKELTRAEEQVMQYLWKLEKGFVKDVVECFPVPRPAYNTVSTIIRILVKKGFVSYNDYGTTHEYYPLVSREDYTSTFLGNFVNSYFNSSYKNLVSFFAGSENISVKELEEMKKMVETEIKKKKKNG